MPKTQYQLAFEERQQPGAKTFLIPPIVDVLVATTSGTVGTVVGTKDGLVYVLPYGDTYRSDARLLLFGPDELEYATPQQEVMVARFLARNIGPEFRLRKERWWEG